MKKIISIIVACLAFLSVNAQDDYMRGISEEISRAVAVIFVLLSFMFFILAILKKIFDYRLKNKIVDKGVSDNLAASILQTDKVDSKHTTIKWFAVLAGLGAGLMIVYYNQPLGIHSLAIMAFSISLSFLGYFFYLKKSGN